MGVEAVGCLFLELLTVPGLRQAHLASFLVCLIGILQHTVCPFDKYVIQESLGREGGKCPSSRQLK